MKINLRALSYSTQTSIYLITAFTIIAEIYKPFKKLLVAFGTHHWIAKGEIAFIVFILSYFLFLKLKDNPELWPKYIYQTIASVIIGGVIIFTFFVWHFFA